MSLHQFLDHFSLVPLFVLETSLFSHRLHSYSIIFLLSTKETSVDIDLAHHQFVVLGTRLSMANEKIRQFIKEVMEGNKGSDFSFNQFVDTATGSVRLKCVGNAQTGCLESFTTSMDFDNLFMMFEHLYRCHRPIFDYLYQDFGKWYNEQVAASIPLSSFDVQTTQDVEVFLEAIHAKTTKQPSTYTKDDNKSKAVDYFLAFGKLNQQTSEAIAAFMSGNQTNNELKAQLHHYTMQYLEKKFVGEMSGHLIKSQVDSFMKQKADHDWLMIPLNAGGGRDEFKNFVVFATFPASLNRDDFGFYVDTTFSDIDAKTRGKMKGLLVINQQSFRSEEVTFDYSEKDGVISGSLIQVVAQKNSIGELEILVGVISIVRKPPIGWRFNQDYWQSNKPRLTQALQYVFGLEAQKELSYA